MGEWARRTDGSGLVGFVISNVSSRFQSAAELSRQDPHNPGMREQQKQVPTTAIEQTPCRPKHNRLGYNYGVAPFHGSQEIWDLSPTGQQG